MQRKNNLLMSLKSATRNNLRDTQGKRPAFAMIMAVVVMIVVATIMAFTLNQTTQTAKRTADMYLYEQTELHAKSAIEYALFKIAETDPTTGCLDNLTFKLPPLPETQIYDVNITMKYVYKDFNCGGSDDYLPTITADEQNGSVLMDVTIRVDAGSEPITYFRRTIQKL